MGLVWDSETRSALKWALLLCLYGILLLASYFAVEAQDSFPFEFSALDAATSGKAIAIAIWLYVVLVIMLALGALRVERRLDRGASDRFRGGNLFFRYGESVFKSTLPLVFDETWSQLRISSVIGQLCGELAKGIESRTPPGIEVTGSLPVTNLNTKDQKVFLRLLARTARGSLVSHFVHFEQLGHAAAVHVFAFARGLESAAEVFLFLFGAPFRIWFWYLPWRQSRYSILVRVSKFDDDSFDLIELQTRYHAINRLLWAETERVLKEFGLLTEELRQVIINNVVNSGQLNIGGSKSQFQSIVADRNSSIGNVSQGGN